ncbi:hypothetical protein EDC96DRAFT_582280 [Choanephora cucurbitarum]|nr:hypothetical protein EDC96DRAFT_582280 [Choanephora cucurbitarum]
MHFYKENDSRAPDNSEALFGSLDSQTNQSKRKDQEKEEQYLVTLSQQNEEEVKVNVEVDDLGIADKRDLLYEAVVDLIDIAKVRRNYEVEENINDIKKNFPNKGEEIPDEVECLLCNHNASSWNHFMSQFSIDADELTLKAVAPVVKRMKENYVELPDYINSCDEESLDINILNLKVAAEEKSFITVEDDVEEKKDSEDVLIVGRATVSKPVLIDNPSLNSNKNNSCYIDAPFELLLRCVLPTINELFVFRCDQKSEFDIILLKSYNNYTTGNVLAGSQLIRDFVWSHNTFVCFQQQDDSKIECKVQDMLPYIKEKYPTMRQFYNAKMLKD